MFTRRFERIALAQLLVGGCAVAFGFIEYPQAQPVNIPHAPPPPVINPSSPNTVPQPSYTPSTPSTPSTTPSTPSTVTSGEVTPSPAKEEPQSTTARSERRAKTRLVHRHRARPIGVGPTLGSFDCSYGWCVRISPPYSYYRPYLLYRY
jgi:hypothetical protein